MRTEKSSVLRPVENSELVSAIYRDRNETAQLFNLNMVHNRETTARLDSRSPAFIRKFSRSRLPTLHKLDVVLQAASLAS